MPSQHCYLWRLNPGDEDARSASGQPSKVYPLTSPLLTLRKDSELGKQQLGRDTLSGDIFHQHQGKELVGFLSRRAATANSRRQKLRCTKLSYKAEVTPLNPNGPGSSRRNSKPCNLLLMSRVCPGKTARYLSLGWSSWAERQKLFDFIVEDGDPACTSRPLRIALKKSTGRLAGFRSSFR